jgi:hypothetical protein
MTVHRPGQLYTYLFSIYRDNGPQHEMTFMRTQNPVGTSRRHATQSLNLAPNERAVWFGGRN